MFCRKNGPGPASAVPLVLRPDGVSDTLGLRMGKPEPVTDVGPERLLGVRVAQLHYFSPLAIDLASCPLYDFAGSRKPGRYIL